MIDARATPCAIQLRGPRSASRVGSTGGQRPAQLRLIAGMSDDCATKRLKECVREKMNVRVGNGEVTPGCLHRVCSSE